MSSRIALEPVIPIADCRPHETWSSFATRADTCVIGHRRPGSVMIQHDHGSNFSTPPSNETSGGPTPAVSGGGPQRILRVNDGSTKLALYISPTGLENRQEKESARRFDDCEVLRYTLNAKDRVILEAQASARL